MPLPKPNKGDPLKSGDFRSIATYAESNTPRAGLSVRIRRTVGGSLISLSPTATLAQSSTSDGGGGELPDGTIVKWDVVEASPAEGGTATRKLVQYRAKWDAENSVFVKDTDTEPTLVYQLPPPTMSPQWGRVWYDEETHELYQYEYTWDAENSEWKQADDKTIIVTLESHASQHE